MPNTTSQHIVTTAANLLGFCLFVIASIHISNRSETSLVDEFTSIVAGMLVISCFFSFFSIRTTDKNRERKLETAAEYFFVASLAGILVIIILIALNFIR